MDEQAQEQIVDLLQMVLTGALTSADASQLVFAQTRDLATRDPSLRALSGVLETLQMMRSNVNTTKDIKENFPLRFIILHYTRMIQHLPSEMWEDFDIEANLVAGGADVYRVSLFGMTGAGVMQVVHKAATSLFPNKETARTELLRMFS